MKGRKCLLRHGFVDSTIGYYRDILCLFQNESVQNISYRDEFNLHENSDLEGGTDFRITSEWFRTKTRTQLHALH